MLENWKGASDDPGVFEHLAGEEIATAFLREDVGQADANIIVLVMKSGRAFVVRAPRGMTGTPSTGVVPPDALPDVVRAHREALTAQRETAARAQRRYDVEAAQLEALPEWMRQPS